MASEALNTRRVKEALQALGDYLDDAVVIAGGISAGQVTKLELEPTPTVPGPRLTSVVWHDTGTRVIVWDSGNTTPKTIDVTGVNLTQAKVFKLVDADATETSFDATIGSKKAAGTGFTATVTLQDPPPFVSYHAYVITESGQTFLLTNAVEIQEPADKYVVYLGGLSVAPARPGRVAYAILFLRNGRRPTPRDLTSQDLYVTDPSGKKLADWRVEIVDKAAIPARVAALVKQYDESEFVPLKIAIPKNAKPGAFSLVAKPAKSKAEGKLAFHLWP